MKPMTLTAVLTLTAAAAGWLRWVLRDTHGHPVR